MIKILAFDLDGTLLTSEKKIDERTKAAIQKAMDQGIHVVLASGRDRAGTRFVYEPLGLENGENFLALINGQIIYDFKKREYDVEDVLGPADGYAIQNVCRQYGIEGIFMCGYDTYSYLSQAGRVKKAARSLLTGEPKDYGLKEGKEERNYIELPFRPYEFTQDINKVCMVETPKFFEKNLPKLRADLKHYDLLMVGPGWLEIMPKGVSKASALKKIAEKVGVSLNEVMAFGDAENDIAMIEEAGIVVAMGNAMDTLKEKADLVTATNNENGIGQVIEALLAGHEEELRKGVLPALEEAA